MKFIRLLFLFSIAAMSGSQATDMLGGNDPFEKRYILDSKKLPEQKIQAAMRQSPVWKSFLQNNGTWYVVFDELTGMPHRASGKPISVSAMNFRDAALVFINDQLGGYGVPQQDLKFQTENFSGKYHNVFFTQKYQGLDILNSRAFVKLTPDMKVSTFGLDVFKVEDLSTQPSIPLTMINSFATKDLSLSVTNISTATLKVLPLPVNGSYEYRLVYELTVSTIDESKIPGQYYSLLDANTGELLYRQNKVRFSHPLNTDIAVSGTVSLYSPFQPTQVMPMRNLKVDDGSNLFNTDSMGEVSLTGASSITATFSLEGFWSQIFTDAGFVTPSIAATFDPGQGMLSFDSVTTLSHVSGYYHVNVIHDFMKSFFPTFTTMDFPLPTRIDVTGGSCNAYYSGSEISFFEASGGCNSMAEIGDIVYHEYGHGINDLFYQWQGSNWQNGGMGEGYADVWGFSITQNPVLGPGFQSASSFIRRYNVNKKVYPQDLTGEVHDDGEIIAGAWYDVSLNIGSWANMTSLFASTYYDLITGPDGDEGRIYTDILLSALNHDDNDADLSNGTPNDSAILAAFELHGISLLNNVNLSHDDVLTASALAPIVIDASMTSQYPWYTIDVRLNYKVNSSLWNQVPMTHNGSGDYTTAIPGQPAGTIITYYLEAFNGSGTSISTNPLEANAVLPNIPYFILVELVQKKVEDFDANQSAGWLTSLPTDDATSGFWIIDTPVPSYENGTILCQTDDQHTFGGLRCAITGNAANNTLGVGNSDVDGGKTTLQSPPIDISAYLEPVVSYWRWYTNDQGSTPRTDSWRTFISEDGINFVAVEDLKIPDHRWRRNAIKVHDILPGATSVTLRFVADDDNAGSVIEAAVDDLEILALDQEVSVNELQGNLAITVYPNPSNTAVNLVYETTAASKGSVEIVNSLGQIIHQEDASWKNGLNHKSINTSNFANGIYRLVLRSENNSSVKLVSILHN